MNEFPSQVVAAVVVVVPGYFLLRWFFSVARRFLSRVSGSYDLGNIELTSTQKINEVKNG